MIEGGNGRWRFGLAIVANDPPQDFIRLVETAEDLGFEYIWVCDSSLHGRDVYAYLTLCAQHTKQAKIGVSVTHPFTRHPAINANAIATIDEISEGRAILGVGTGDRPQQELGIRPARVAEMQEWIPLLRNLISGEPVSYSGEHWQAKDATVRYALRRDIPIQVAASGPRMLKLAGAMGDGAIVRVGMAPEGVVFALEHLAAGVAEAGGEMDDKDIGFLVNCCIYDDRDRALREARLDTAWYLQTAPKIAEVVGVPEETMQAVREAYRGGHLNQAQEAASNVPDELAQQFVLAGTPDEAKDLVHRIGEKGVRRLEIFTMGPDRHQIVRSFGEHIIPAFR
ncbi:MAG: LLM class flavin-dependent oxidoreductase [Alphaproteobacteria bacterium]|nr:LLM class flavin-dependent oxidoreductase [Alphaproteobacteria bacterium]